MRRTRRKPLCVLLEVWPLAHVRKQTVFNQQSHAGNAPRLSDDRRRRVNGPTRNATRSFIDVSLGHGETTRASILKSRIGFEAARDRRRRIPAPFIGTVWTHAFG